MICQSPADRVLAERAKHEESPALDEALASIGAAQDVQSLTQAVERFHEVAENQPLPARELNSQRAAAYRLAVDVAVRDDPVTEEEAGAIR